MPLKARAMPADGKRGVYVFTCRGETYNHVLVAAVAAILANGRPSSPRGLLTHEVRDVRLELTDPQRRYPTLDGRNANIFALVAETLWVLAGRDDVEFIAAYLPRMRNYSKDGLTLPGAYGPRLRNWSAVDQLAAVVRTMETDADSRRGVISLFDPVRDHDAESPDIPCCIAMQFVLRDDLLHLTVHSRSMDVMWGSAVNFFEWTVLLEAMAYWLNARVGVYAHSIGSLHLYDPFVPRANRMMNLFGPGPAGPDHELVRFDLPFHRLDSELSRLFAIEADWRRGHHLDQEFRSDSSWLTRAGELLRISWIARTGTSSDPALALLDRMKEGPDRLMALHQITYWATKR
jgi:thymidylate synthase